MAIADLIETDLAGSGAEVADPAEIAARIVRDHEDDPGWLDAFAEALHRERGANEARRVFTVWGINYSEAGRIFGVSRQAVSRWVTGGIPATQTVAFADLSTATDILAHYIGADRIPAVVRRPAPALDGLSLIDLLAQGRTPEVVDACKHMFQFTGAHR